MIDPERTCCVVDALEDKVILWHVHTGADLGMSRMTGAWTVATDDPDTVALLVTRRRALVTSRGVAELERLEVPVVEHIDPEGTLDNIELVRDELQSHYERHPNRRTLVAPSWPRLPEPIDVRRPPTVATEAPKGAALAVARWLAGVATTWERIESERLVRKYMPGGPERRVAPLAVRERS
ncbi:hypothetical protein FHR84_001029 [Actinopolyspora biskrensis]|uniref:Uncharacterized protein n=1 Tax=Actinopolyspora biskrensis TaxID=1470178 RepID=A0A852YXP1_9ACTN|nr:hypothetical protein [Actinopolyspora biskrensis]NYH77715.1 hypothetical protein [Actinopolyspora biskrensis]